MGLRLLKNRNGAAMAELAIILPIFIIVLFAIFEFGLIMYDKAMITNASREGARAGIVFRVDSNENYSPLGTNDITAIVNNYLAGNLVSFSSASASTTVNPSQCPALTEPTREIQVTVNYEYTFLILPNFIAGLVPINLAASTIMKCE